MTTERKPWLISSQSDKDGMSLPAGKTCQTCVWLDRCRKLFGVNPDNQVCDWSPCRYRSNESL